MNPIKILFFMIVLVFLFSFWYIPLFYKGVDKKVLILKAEEFLKSKFGEAYFNKYFTLNSVINNTVMYNYRITVNNYTKNEKVIVKFDNGEIIETIGVVDCVKDSNKCMPFKIDKEKAIEIARKAGLEEGTIGYGADMRYSDEIDGYVWDVRSLTKELERPPEEGRGVLIDPVTGDVYKIFKFPKEG